MAIKLNYRLSRSRTRDLCQWTTVDDVLIPPTSRLSVRPSCALHAADKYKNRNNKAELWRSNRSVHCSTLHKGIAAVETIWNRSFSLLRWFWRTHTARRRERARLYYDTYPWQTRRDLFQRKWYWIFKLYFVHFIPIKSFYLSEAEYL